MEAACCTVVISLWNSAGWMRKTMKLPTRFLSPAPASPPRSRAHQCVSLVSTSFSRYCWAPTMCQMPELRLSLLLRYAAAAAAKSLQLCPTLCHPIDGSPPGSPVPGILQARTLEWVAISFSRWSSWSRDRTWVSGIAGRCFNLWATREALLLLLLSHFSHVQLCATP